MPHFGPLPDLARNLESAAYSVHPPIYAAVFRRMRVRRVERQFIEVGQFRIFQAIAHVRLTGLR